MRLLVVSQYFWPEEFRINDLVAELVARGHDVTVLTGKPNYPAGRFFPEFVQRPESFSIFHGARIVRVPMLPRGQGSFRLLLNFASYAVSAAVVGVRALRGRSFDAMFVFQVSPVTVGLPAIVLRRLRKWPIAFWVLDQWPDTLSAVGALRSRIALRMVGRLVSFIYARCDLILAPSENLLARLRNEWPGKSLAYFPNWVEPTYTNSGIAAAPELPVEEGRFNILFAGNIGESQDFPAILDAASRLKDDPRIRWLIVGDGRMAGWVGDEVARRGLGERVVLLGRHPPERMPSFYHHADALLVSLKAEPIFSMTIPGKLQSYLACGLPIVGMLNGEGAAVIQRASAGVTCAAGDSQQLAQSVLHLAALSDGERKAMGARGRAYAEREFDRAQLVTRLEGLLESLASGASA